MSDKAAGAAEPPAFQLLSLEQSEFERFLHDELGQCLVAIRSMAATLEDEAPNEIAQIISQAADDSYVEVYDRMMELRAESLALQPAFDDAIRQCIDDVRLEARDLSYRLSLENGVAQITDPLCRRLLLRSLRCIAIVVKRLADDAGELVIDIGQNGAYLDLSFKLLPGGFPAACRDHLRIKRLEARLHPFGGELSQDEATIGLRLPRSDLGNT